MKKMMIFSCRRFFKIIAIMMMLFVWGCSSSVPQKVENVPPIKNVSSVVQVSKISTEPLVGKLRITITANSELTYTAFKLTDPLRLVLDLPNSDTSAVSELVFANQDPLMRITPFRFTDGDAMNSRVEVALSHLIPYQVFSDANKLFIDLETPLAEKERSPTSVSSLPPGFEELTLSQEKTPIVIASKPGEAVTPNVSVTPISSEIALVQPSPEQEEQLPTIQIEPPPMTVGTVKTLPGGVIENSLIKDIEVAEVDGKTRIIIYADKIPEFDVKETQTPPRLTVDFKQSDLPPGVEKVLTPDNVETIIKQVRLFQLQSTPGGVDNVVRMRVDLTKSAQHEVKTESGKLMMDIPHSTLFAQGQEEPTKAVGSGEVPLTTGIESALKTEETTTTSETAESPTIRAAKTGEEKEYKGQLITLHFQEAPILDVLQVIAEVSGLNLVVHPGISGTVTVHLVNIPWDQALDIILKMNNLSVEIDGTILRVASASIFQQEVAQRVEQQRQQITARQVQEELQPLETKLITINFAEPSALQTLILEYFQGQLPANTQQTRRGKITIDARTKTLIVQDTADNIKKIEEIVATLDRRTPQVMIEAKVVAINSSFRKELGINWFGSFAVDPAHGNALDYRFPYSIGSTTNFGVNLPQLSGSAIGTTGTIRLGSIDDVLTMFAKIDAAEEESKAKTLAQPKIFTQDNKAASVNAGISRQIGGITTIAPDGTITTQTATVTAALTLSVTPRISNDGFISMTVNVTNGAFLRATGGELNQQAVNSEITVKDGETVVIGGVYQTEERKNFAAVPYLHKIPLIGRLFESTNPNTQSQSELLVFLTPRILDRQVLKPEQQTTDASFSY